MKTSMKKTLLDISPIRMKRKLGRLGAALLLTLAAITCSLTMWATPVEEQDKVKKLETGLAILLATVKEQAAQIERVTGQVQTSKRKQSLALNIP